MIQYDLQTKLNEFYNIFFLFYGLFIGLSSEEKQLYILLGYRNTLEE